MMRNELEYYIPYVEEGEEKMYPVTINYVFNYVYKENAELYKIRAKVQDYANRLNQIQAESKGADEKRLDELTTEIKEKVAYIESHQDFFERQFKLINSILVDNGIKDKEINTLEFWERKVTPENAIRFLDKVIRKDITKGDGKGKK